MTTEANDTTTAPVDDTSTAADPKTVLRMCREGGHPTLAEALLEEEATVADVEAAITRAKAITDLCVAAELSEMADGYIGSDMQPDAVRKHLAAYAAKADGGEISGHRDPDTRATQKPRIDVAAIYAARNKRTRATQQES